MSLCTWTSWSKLESVNLEPILHGCQNILDLNILANYFQNCCHDYYWWQKRKQRELIPPAPRAQFKQSRQLLFVLLQPVPILTKPWFKISVEFLTNLPPAQGFTTIWPVVNNISKMAHFVPLFGLTSALWLGQIHFKEILSLYGSPVYIVSDCGVYFVSKLWSALY